MAAVVADRVGANPAAAYDTNAACAGYAYAVAQADALIRAGAATYALVIGAEKLSDVVDPTDRSISFLLGDGAGAVVIGPSDTPGIAPTVWGSDGSKADAVSMNGTLTEFRDGTAALDDLVGVHGVGDGLAHALVGGGAVVGAGRLVVGVHLVRVEHQLDRPDPRRGAQEELRMLVDDGGQVGRDVDGDVDLPVLERGHPYGVVGDRPEHDGLDLRARPASRAGNASITISSSFDHRTNL